MTVPNTYIPNYLSRKQKKKVKAELKKSRKKYKSGIFHKRKNIKGVKSKKSRWQKKFINTFKIKNDDFSLNNISKVTKCDKASLNKIIKKGMGAYYSSGSRPNQTPHSWGKARLYSALSGGPAANVDKNILIDGCAKNSKVLKLAKTAKTSNKYKKVKL